MCKTFHKEAEINVMNYTNNGETIAIECRNLWKIFGDQAQEALVAAQSGDVDKDSALEKFGCVIGVADASFSVKKGEIFCIMGLSGSGKSTVIRHVNRLIEPTSGEVYVEGRDVMGLSDNELRELRARKIGMAFQHMALWPHKKIAENVAFGLEVQKVPKNVRLAAAEDVLERVGLGGWGDRYPDQLSGGMQQRVGLARALAANPDILLMDEPFSALDPLIRNDLQNEFLALSREVKKTTLFITHDLDEAMKMGDRVAIMKDGRIDQTGTPEEIVLHPKTDYVARFVGSMSTLKYLSASEIAVPGEISSDAPRFASDASLPMLIEALSEGVDHLVIMEGDTVIGRIGRPELLGAVGRDLVRT